MSRGAKCPVRKGAGRGKGVGGRADSRLQGFGFWGSMSRAQGAGRGARGARRGKGLGGGRGWARGALGTATRAAAPGDGLRAEARGAGAARRPFYRPQTILSPPMVKANGRFIKRGQPVDHFIARRRFSPFYQAKAAREAQGPVDRFIARRPFYRPRWPFIKAHGRFIERRQPVDHFIARRPFHRRFIKPRQPVDHFIKPVDHFIIQKSSKTRAHPPYRGKWFAPLDLRESI